jgi:hypothetical protein
MLYYNKGNNYIVLYQSVKSPKWAFFTAFVAMFERIVETVYNISNDCIYRITYHENI